VISQRVQAAAVVLFVLVIASVVVVLLERADRDAPAAKGQSSDQRNDLESAAGDPVGAVVITAGTGDLVVRFRTGSCTEPGGPELELSDNRSRTFRQIRVPQVDDGTGVSASSPSVMAIAWARATSRFGVEVAAADSKCNVHMYSTTDAGATWEKTDNVDVWYEDPKTGGVVAPTGTVDAGCKDVVSIMPGTKAKNAKVACADGAFRTTSDGGVTWTDAGRLPGTSVAVFTGPMTGFASVAENKCKSRIHATVDGGLTWVPKGCVHKDFVIPGLTGTNKRLVAGGSAGTRVSTDDGRSWEVPTMK
jgi:hypothetical protein